MAKVEFNFKGSITTILCSEDDNMEKICENFTTKTGSDIKNLYFLYSGNQINFQSKFSQIINTIDKNRKTMSIAVNEINQDYLNKSSKITKSIYPICPICTENMKFDINDYKINLSGCLKRH